MSKKRNFTESRKKRTIRNPDVRKQLLFLLLLLFEIALKDRLSDV